MPLSINDGSVVKNAKALHASDAGTFKPGKHLYAMEHVQVVDNGPVEEIWKYVGSYVPPATAPPGATMDVSAAVEFGSTDFRVWWNSTTTAPEAHYEVTVTWYVNGVSQGTDVVHQSSAPVSRSFNVSYDIHAVVSYRNNMGSGPSVTVYRPYW